MELIKKYTTTKMNFILTTRRPVNALVKCVNKINLAHLFTIGKHQIDRNESVQIEV